MIDIFDYRKNPEGDHEYILATKKGGILLTLSEIGIGQYASPVLKDMHVSVHHHNLIHEDSSDTPWAIDTARLDISIQQQIVSEIENNNDTADYLFRWLLVFSTLAYPQVEQCVRGICKVSSALANAHNYLRSLDQVPFDQVWYTNLMTRPVQVWPYNLGKTMG